MVTRARIALYRSLRRRRDRVREGLYLVEGRRLLEEALESGASVLTVLLTEPFRESGEAARLLAAAERRGVPVETIPARDLARLAETKSPQGAIGVLRREPPEKHVLTAPGLQLALDGVSDPGNVGTLIRAADAFGASAVVLGPGTADPDSGKVLRAAMGSSFHLPVVPVADLPAFLSAAPHVLAATLKGESLYEAGFDPPRTVLVLGSEARGVSPEVRAVAHREVTIPCPGRAESLNVAMAGAIALAHLARRREEGA